FEACLHLGIEPDFELKKTAKPRDTFAPRKGKIPGDLWQQKASAIIADAQQGLWDKRAWMAFTDPDLNPLKGLQVRRGLTENTIRQAELGWVFGGVYDNPKSWGIKTEISEKTGEPKKIWVPSGLLIPGKLNGKIIKLKVRLWDPIGSLRYILVSGSDPGPTVLENRKTFCIVESELDALLIHQEAGDLVSSVALGSAQVRPSTDLHKKLLEADTILVALDSDEAGGKQAWQFWLKTYTQAKRWPVPIKKDPGEAFQAGLNIRAWIIAGLSNSTPSTKVRTGENNCEIEKTHTQRILAPEADSSGLNCLGAICGEVRYRPVDGSPYLWCEQQNKAVIDIQECPKGNWAKDEKGFPM
ncbi:toprim domain-containing protein, partial [Thermodesulfobacteriota bacterium]